MSVVFISYTRSDEAKAKHVAEALRAAGFQVWRDEQLPAHRAYYEVIEERLRAARAVVVLWSTAAAQSQWVRAEADLAREQGKLVQVSVDGALPPMPFNQIQCVPLKTWHGAPEHREWLKVLDSVRALAAGDEAPVAATRRSGRWRLPGAVALAGALLLAGGFVLIRDRWPAAQAANGPRIAVVPFETLGRDPEEAEFAVTLADDIAGMLRENDIQTVPRSVSGLPAGPARTAGLKRVGVRYALGGSVRREEGRLKARAHLEDLASQVTVWSAEFDRPEAEAVALRDAVAVASTESIGSALEPLAQPGLKLEPQTVALWIKAENATKNPQMLAIGTGLRATEQVVAQAPDFVAARGVLAVNLVVAIRAASPADRPALLARLRSEAQRAIRSNPSTSGSAYDALFSAELLEHPRNFVQAETFLLKGMAADSSLPFLPMRECRFLLDMGRLRESLRYCQNASALDPLAAPVGYTYGTALAATGQPELARQILARGFRYHPNHMQTRRARFDLEAFTGSPDAALGMLRDPAQRSQLWSEETVAALELFLRARKTGAAPDRRQALSALFAAAAAGRQEWSYVILAAATFGDVDAAFAALDASMSRDPGGLSNSGSAFGALLSPVSVNLRRDPRFWDVARRTGRLDYWRARGAWPDFCSNPAEAIDCKTAAEGAAAAAG